MALPSQEELRRRIRAGRVLADLTIEELASKLPPEAEMGERVLRNLENGHTRIKPQALYVIADAIDLPVEWFTSPTIASLFDPTGSGFAARLARLEAALEEAQTHSEDPDSPGSETPTTSQPSSSRRGPRASRRKSEP